MIQLTKPFQVSVDGSEFQEDGDDFVKFIGGVDVMINRLIGRIVAQHLDNLGESTIVFFEFIIVELRYFLDVSVQFEEELGEHRADKLGQIDGIEVMVVDYQVDILDDLLEVLVVHIIDRPFRDLMGYERFAELHDGGETK